MTAAELAAKAKALKGYDYLELSFNSIGSNEPYAFKNAKALIAALPKLDTGYDLQHATISGRFFYSSSDF